MFCGVLITSLVLQGAGPLVPYGVLCVRELFRFLVSLCNPLNKENSEVIIHTGLTLLTVALEVGADAIGKYATLLTIVKDDLCRNLFMVRVMIFSRLRCGAIETLRMLYFLCRKIVWVKCL